MSKSNKIKLYQKEKQEENKRKNIQLNKERIEKCFGNCLTDLCLGHHDCEHYESQVTSSEAVGCLQVTNERHGVCICKYKRYCHIARQESHIKFGRVWKEETVEQCPIYIAHQKQDNEEAIREDK